MNQPLTGSIERACGVRTNGIGRITTDHLNLTRALADVCPWSVQKPKPKIVESASIKKPKAEKKPRAKPEPDPRIPFAGKEHPGPLRLVDSSGSMFLHQSGAAMTKDKQYAWCGNRQQLEALRAKIPAARTLHEVIA